MKIVRNRSFGIQKSCSMGISFSIAHFSIAHWYSGGLAHMACRDAPRSTAGAGSSSSGRLMSLCDSCVAYR